MDLTLFDFRRLITPSVTIEPADVQLEEKWTEFEKTLAEFKVEYFKKKCELNKLIGVIAKNKDELNVIKYAINNVHMQDTANMLKSVYEHTADMTKMDILYEEASRLSGICKSMKKILMETNIENFNKFTCSICTESLVDTFVDPCGHVFCENCLGRTTNKTHCPMCRTQINTLKRIYTV
jgi:hypothetical protein